MNHDVTRFAKLAVRVWGCEMDEDHPEKTAKAGIDALKAFLKDIGMPGNFKELGADEKDIDQMAHTACWGDGRKGTIGSFVPLDEAAVKEIYRLML